VLTEEGQLLRTFNQVGRFTMLSKSRTSRSRTAKKPSRTRRAVRAKTTARKTIRRAKPARRKTAAKRTMSVKRRTVAKRRPAAKRRTVAAKRRPVAKRRPAAKRSMHRARSAVTRPRRKARDFPRAARHHLAAQDRARPQAGPYHNRAAGLDGLAFHEPRVCVLV